MTHWQIIMAASLTAQVILAVVMWGHTVARTRGMLLPPGLRRVIRHSWALALIPLSEAAVLYGAGFWSV